MYRRVTASIPDECFLPISKRKQRGTFFLRITQYSDEIAEWLWKYHEAARQKGVILENQIQNPDERQLNYYMETMGTAFSSESALIRLALQKWMPRMSESVRIEFSEALCAQLQELRRQGKSEGIQKNVYIKLMCWLYYKFERLMPYLGQDDAPKILYESSSITNHELILLRLLMSMGTDIVLLETLSDEAYKRLDAVSACSQLLSVPGGKPFPVDFSLKKFRKEHMHPCVQMPPFSQDRAPSSRPAVIPGSNVGSTIDVEKRLVIPSKAPCTNAWMKKADWQEVRTPPNMRGTDTALFYNAFLRVNGAQDKLTYVNELYQFYQQMQTEGRKVCILDGALPIPSPDEIQKIRRRNYRSAEEMTLDLIGNIPAAASVDLQRMMQLAFARTMKQAQMMLEQRTQDLRTAENVAMQSIPMLKTMQFSNMNLVRKINSAFIITLPVFKQALAQAIMLKRQKIQADAISALDERTNEMLIKNARNTVEQAKMTTRMAAGSSIKADTLETTWRTIVEGIDETRRIQEEAHKQRIEDQAKLERIKQEFQAKFSMPDRK